MAGAGAAAQGPLPARSSYQACLLLLVPDSDREPDGSFFVAAPEVHMLGASQAAADDRPRLGARLPPAPAVRRALDEVLAHDHWPLLGAAHLSAGAPPRLARRHMPTAGCHGRPRTRADGTGLLLGRLTSGHDDWTVEANERGQTTVSGAEIYTSAARHHPDPRQHHNLASCPLRHRRVAAAQLVLLRPPERELHVVSDRRHRRDHGPRCFPTAAPQRHRAPGPRRGARLASAAGGAVLAAAEARGLGERSRRSWPGQVCLGGVAETMGLLLPLLQGHDGGPHLPRGRRLGGVAPGPGARELRRQLRERQWEHLRSGRKTRIVCFGRLHVHRAPCLWHGGQLR
mmetsp:Transcript_4227/g.15807  ORF Transcript_4227/g.15807 Transcript_4227/m.15807 type:complete len:343 (+) Transcript_4227:1348-2376(+)